MTSFTKERVTQSEKMLALTNTFSEALLKRCKEEGVEVVRLRSHDVPMELRMSINIGGYHTPFLMNKTGSTRKQLCILYNDGVKAYWLDVVQVFN